jgi:hypothetical protein
MFGYYLKIFKLDVSEILKYCVDFYLDFVLDFCEL